MITLIQKDSIHNYMYTEFIRIVAADTLNFSLARVRLLIEDGFYLFWRDTFAPIRWYLVIIFQDYSSKLIVEMFPTQNGAPETCMFQHISCMEAIFMCFPCMFQDSLCMEYTFMHVSCMEATSMHFSCMKVYFMHETCM